MAGRRIDPFINAVVAFAQKDSSATKTTIDGRLKKREFKEFVFFHDSNGMPVLFARSGSHDRIKKNMICFAGDKQIEEATEDTVMDRVICKASQGEDLYRGNTVLSFLDALLLSDSRLNETLRREIAAAEGRAG